MTVNIRKMGVIYMPDSDGPAYVKVKLRHPGITYDTPCYICRKPTVWMAWIPREHGWTAVCKGQCAREAAAKPPRGGG